MRISHLTKKHLKDVKHKAISVTATLLFITAKQNTTFMSEQLNI